VHVTISDMSPRRLLSGILLLLCCALATPAYAASSAFPTKTRTAIGPGVQMVTAGRICTADFVFSDRAGRRYLGYAAHCASRGPASARNGCTTPSYPLGTRVTFVTGRTATSRGTVLGHGRLRYSAWRTMHRLGVTNLLLCRSNDFALVRVGRASVHKVNPTVPFWGGPVALGGTPATGSHVFGYVGAAARGGLGPWAPTVARHFAWTTRIATGPTTLADTGGGLMDDHGRAVSVLVARSSQTSPTTDLLPAVRYARHHGMGSIRLVPGHRHFRGSATV
jgi:hypothetical protein